jgi:hypothetical protein
MGVAKDRLGSYSSVIWLFVGIYGVLSLAALFVTPVRRERAEKGSGFNCAQHPKGRSDN